MRIDGLTDGHDEDNSAFGNYAHGEISLFLGNLFSLKTSFSRITCKFLCLLVRAKRLQPSHCTVPVFMTVTFSCSSLANCETTSSEKKAICYDDVN
jgi:hypothetical protein